MFSDNSHKKTVTSSGWLTTFGDLLTLLVCFFITIFSMTPLSETVIDKTASNREAVDSGTPFAGSNDEGSKIEILVEAAEYAESGTAVEEKVQKVVKDKVQLEDRYVKEAVIETCFDAVELYEGEGWHRSMERSLQLRSQLVDAGVAGNLIAIRSVGPWCQTLNENKNMRAFVSRVVFTMGQVVHG